MESGTLVSADDHQQVQGPALGPISTTQTDPDTGGVDEQPQIPVMTFYPDLSWESDTGATPHAPQDLPSLAESRKRIHSQIEDRCGELVEAGTHKYTILDQGVIAAKDRFFKGVAESLEFVNGLNVPQDDSDALRMLFQKLRSDGMIMYTPPRPKRKKSTVTKHPTTVQRMRHFLVPLQESDCEESRHSWLAPPPPGTLPDLGARCWTASSQALIRTGGEGLISKEAGIRLDTYALRKAFIWNHLDWRHRGKTPGISITTDIKDICLFWFPHLWSREERMHRKPLVNLTLINMRAHVDEGFPLLDVGREMRRYLGEEKPTHESGDILPCISTKHRVALWNVPSRFIVGTFRVDDIEQWMEDHSEDLLRRPATREHFQSYRTALRYGTGAPPFDLGEDILCLFTHWWTKVAQEAWKKHDEAIRAGKNPEHIPDCACCLWREKDDQVPSTGYNGKKRKGNGNGKHRVTKLTTVLPKADVNHFPSTTSKSSELVPDTNALAPHQPSSVSAGANTMDA